MRHRADLPAGTERLDLADHPAGTTGTDWIGTVYGSRMLLNAQTGCPGSRSLLWYDPRTKAGQWVLRTPVTQIGVMSAVPYYTCENS